LDQTTIQLEKLIVSLEAERNERRENLEKQKGAVEKQNAAVEKQNAAVEKQNATLKDGVEQNVDNHKA